MEFLTLGKEKDFKRFKWQLINWDLVCSIFILFQDLTETVLWVGPKAKKNYHFIQCQETDYNSPAQWSIEHVQ